MTAPEFRTRLVVEVSDKPGMFVVELPFVYYSARLGQEIIVPAGFETDFASIPRIFHSIIEVNGRHRKAAVIHDYLCVHKKDLGMLQGLADKIFREAMKVVDVHFVESSVMYQVVRRYQKITSWLKGESYA